MKKIRNWSESSQTWSPANETGNIMPPLLLFISFGKGATVSSIYIS